MPSTCEVCMSSSSSIYLMTEGKKIHLTGERGLLLAKYVDGMMNLALSVDDRGLVYNYPSFSREFVDRINYMITTSVFSSHWITKNLRCLCFYRKE
ncbi:unnamed protein product [Eruca vesicaria subsp. sativa]|uniref:Uncharacterized protein n=1 Tax=Eruca vesicaria subsp. sativa TaxID=29727 RepID=A0ABC8LLT4_ERUVS|nr:unnamed protein product [Eruca vesicaria subsp. sativa]